MEGLEDFASKRNAKEHSGLAFTDLHEGVWSSFGIECGDGENNEKNHQRSWRFMIISKMLYTNLKTDI